MLDFVKRPFIIHKPFDDFFGGHKLEDGEIFVFRFGYVKHYTIMKNLLSHITNSIEKVIIRLCM